MDSLGSRIRSLRKKRKLTLEKLAGKQMTKGMLSLIENDKAQPSMENLSYIAAKLDIGVNELLENISTSEIREILTKAEKNFIEKKYNAVVEELEKIIEEKLPSVYETAKLLEIYCKACYFKERNEWLVVFERADELYMSLKLYNQSAKLNHFLVWTEMNEYHYERALELLINKREILYDKRAELDVITELDFIWNEVILLFAIDEYAEASKRLNEAISFSKQKKVFYRIEELYRLAYYYALMNNKVEDMNFYLNKLTLLAEFTESAESKLNLLALRIYYNNSYAKLYNEALILLEELHSVANDDLKYFYVMEKGKALYGKQDYERALDYLLQFEEVKEWNNPFDLSIMYEVFAYIARCYHHLGQNEKATYYANYAMERVEKFPKTPSKVFIIETSEILNRKQS